jgi:hypothetical protein
MRLYGSTGHTHISSAQPANHAHTHLPSDHPVATITCAESLFGPHCRGGVGRTTFTGLNRRSAKVNAALPLLDVYGQPAGTVTL